jgi:hypothetical protein
MTKNRIVILVEGGVVQQVSATDPEAVEVILVDEDNIAAGDEDPRARDPGIPLLLADSAKLVL